MNTSQTPIKYPCPCCGYLVFSELPGSYDICPICDWEDDDAQLRNPEMKGGANKMSLVEAQKNFAEFGSKGTEHISHTRKITESDMRYATWRMIQNEKDMEKMSLEDFSNAYQKDPRMLYYWERNKVQ